MRLDHPGDLFQCSFPFAIGDQAVKHIGYENYVYAFIRQRKQPGDICNSCLDVGQFFLSYLFLQPSDAITIDVKGINPPSRAHNLCGCF